MQRHCCVEPRSPVQGLVGPSMICTGSDEKLAVGTGGKVSARGLCDAEKRWLALEVGDAGPAGHCSCEISKSKHGGGEQGVKEKGFSFLPCFLWGKDESLKLQLKSACQCNVVLRYMPNSIHCTLV